MSDRAGGSGLDKPVRPTREGAAGRARLAGARVPVVVGIAALIVTSIVWSVPRLFTVLAALAIVVAALVPVRRDRRKSWPTAPDDTANWPDDSMKAIIKALGRPAFLLDSQGYVRFMNQAAQDAASATRVGDPLDLTFREPQLREALHAAAAGIESAVEHRERGEAERVYAIQLQPVQRHEAAPRFILAVLDDTTDRLAVARMRADFVANASHELRTPLASLTGFIETLQGPASGDAEARERFLAIMLEQAERMRRLIDDLLSLSRVEMQVHQLPTDQVDLSEVIRHVADALTPLATELGVRMTVTMPGDPVAIQGDRDELIQVFQNLIENGLKYGGSGGKLDIGVGADGGSVSVGIKDYGPGIAPEDLPRLTERFYRVDIENSRAQKGTGLGLAIVKHIVARHRGQISIESVPGEGALFTITLPIQALEK